MDNQLDDGEVPDQMAPEEEEIVDKKSEGKHSHDEHKSHDNEKEEKNEE